ncbi:hypothetical protein [Aquimarina sp. 2304DJ70-9]|uniref:hypothetical protein n=1 Tax=Aquimarina penaris TaxID=3231044 RepID=UPI0034619EE7
MNLEDIVKDEASNFYQFGDWKRYDHTPTGLKDALETELYNHSDSTAKLIFLYEVLRQIKEEYEKHLVHCQHKNEPMKCGQNKEFLKNIYYVEQVIAELNPKFDFTILKPEVNADLIHENLKKLSDFSEVASLYQSALDKINEGKNERNLLDDLRLSYELLLKNILGNNKSLENQDSELGRHLKEMNISSECRNMFQTLNNYYRNYQNTYVKHNDKVKSKEVSLILNLTSSMVNFLINNGT